MVALQVSGSDPLSAPCDFCPAKSTPLTCALHSQAKPFCRISLLLPFIRAQDPADGLFLSPEPGLCSHLWAFALVLGLPRTALSCHRHLLKSFARFWFWVRWSRHTVPCWCHRIHLYTLDSMHRMAL